jgi:Secretion system C-terminal sorting domain
MGRFLFSILMSIAIHFDVKSQTITTIIGSGVMGYTGDGGSCMTAELNHPDVLRFDRFGYIYIADELNNVVRKVDHSNTISTIAGSGTGGFYGDGGPATNAKIAHASDVILDSFGTIYIGSFGAIRKVNMAGTISTIAGTGVQGNSGAEGPATAIQISDPLGLVFDTEGNLYYSDNGTFRIRKISTSGNLTTVAGTGIEGYSGDGGAATIAQIGDVGYMALDSSGNLIFPDYGHAVRKINLHSGIITTIMGDGTPGYSGDGGPATAALFRVPYAIQFDQNWNMYVTDGAAFVVRKIDAVTGIITTIAGSGVGGGGGDGGPATDAQFGDYVNCSAIDRYGNLYIADPESNRIRMVTYHSVGVDNIQSPASSLNLYPNPARNQITINVAAVMEGTITITNIIGQIMHTQEYHSGSATIDVADLPKGLYIVKVIGTAYTAKFVKE